MLKELTYEEAHRLFHYDPDTGIVTRKVNMFKYKRGTVVGIPDKHYLKMSVYNKTYLLHRFIWFYQTGKWPQGEIDHENRQKRDNRWKNLRITTKLGNSINRGIKANNISGVTGVSLHKASGKWQARISANRKNIALGIFSNFSDAVKARYTAEQELNYHLAFNESPAKRYLIEQNLL